MRGGCCAGVLACHYWGGVLGRFCWGVVANAAPPTDVGMVTVGLTVLTDAGSELPADFAEVAAVRVASLAEAGEVTLGVAGVAAAESVSRADAADGFSVVVTEQIAVGGSTWTAVVPVNMVNVQTDTVGDHRFSPGVGCRVPLDRRNCDEMTYWDDMTHWERLELRGGGGVIVTVLRTVDVAHLVTLIFMTLEIMKKGGNGMMLRRPRVIGSPIACMRTEVLGISRMLLDRSLPRSRSP